MQRTENGQIIDPIKEFEINGSMILAFYKGDRSKYDILLKYRQKYRNGEWSQPRTPRHIHWTVDILMKLEEDRDLTKEFLDFMLSEWENTSPLESDCQRQSIDLQEILDLTKAEIEKFQNLSQAGEYSIKFLILLAKLLMVQEKTNNREAYMFKKLLCSIRDDNELCSVISNATFGGRNY